MSYLLDRLASALAPDYQVERLLNLGGMGIVFLADDVALGRKVAIKVLPPESATERSARHFLREAQTLARLSHPNIVPVHHAGEADGLFYYVMDYITGATLAERIAKGPLPRQEAVRIVGDVLRALEACHGHGVVHCDIKPANVFLLEDRALLGDFGIATPPEDVETTTTPSEGVRGTPAYMAPEQAAGRAVTPRSDLYAVGSILYEALSGRHWTQGIAPRHGDWSGVPAPLARIIRKALMPSPQDRWADARTFRRALRRTRTPPLAPIAAGLMLLGLVGGIVLARVWPMGFGGTTPTLTIRIAPFEQQGATVPPRVADSLARRVDRTLSWISDFRVVSDSLPARREAVVLQGEVRADGPTLVAEVRSETWGGLARPILVTRTAPAGAWDAMLDSLAYQTLHALWREGSPLRRWLPQAAMPVTGRGFDQWVEAERLYSEGRWEDAYGAYDTAILVDSTCFLCSLRMTEINRWLMQPVARPHADRVLSHLDLFPDHYRHLINARLVPLSLRARLDTLEALTDLWPDFYYGWFLYAEELLNRGPLSGELRAASVPSYRRATGLRPDYAPAWWGLAWALISGGEAAEARRALESFPARRDQFSEAIAALLGVAFTYRFAGTEAGASLAAAAMENEAVSGYAGSARGPRWLPSFEAPEGAVSLGALFGASPDPQMQRSGLLAQFFGHRTLGQLTRAADRAREYAERFPEDDGFPVTVAMLDALAFVVDPEGVEYRPADRARLERWAAPNTGSPSQRADVRWMLTLVARRSGPPLTGDAAAGPALPAPLAVFLRADTLAAAGDLAGALALGDSLRAWEIANDVPNPFFRTALHVLRSEWYRRAGNLEAARRELRWHEALDQTLTPRQEPNVQEVDWAFGTLGRWKRALILDQLGEEAGEICDSYGAVARLWRSGDPPYSARADDAVARFTALRCPTP